MISRRAPGLGQNSGIGYAIDNDAQRIRLFLDFRVARRFDQGRFRPRQKKPQLGVGQDQPAAGIALFLALGKRSNLAFERMRAKERIRLAHLMARASV